MGHFVVGGLSTEPASDRPELVAGSTWTALQEAGLLDQVGVVEIDPSVSDTAVAQREFQLPLESLANCVVVAGKREGEERFAACVVLATTRADVNGLVKRHLDVRKASFLPMERAVGLTGMEYGGITPIGLPAEWPVLVDRSVVEGGIVVIGSGVRRSKILLPGSLLGRLESAVVVENLGLPIQPG
jgi:prolyl-tRNA editing enzyme YbaK/EbsC (Cys-tRNA(Pro) deacylase)